MRPRRLRTRRLRSVLLLRQHGNAPKSVIEPSLTIFFKVVTPEELEILDSNTKQAGQLYNALMDRKKSDDWKKMIERRDKLITFDEQLYDSTPVVIST